MKIKIVLFLAIITTQICNTQNMPVKFILHIDVNKTIIAEDTTHSKTLDAVLVESLAKHYKGIWDASLGHEITYVQYVENYLFPGDKSNKELRKKRGEAVSSFFEFLKNSKDPRYSMILEHFMHAREKVQSQGGKVFASFYKLISYLEKKGIPYVLLLRTFGNDLPVVAHEIATTINLTFEWDGHFIEGKLHLRSAEMQELIILETVQEIFGFFTSHSHVKIRDSFKTWNDNREQPEYGKLFPINTGGTGVKTVFFDDHAEDDIINPRDCMSGAFLDPGELMKKGIICPVDTIQAIEDDDYFIKRVMQILR